MPLVNFFLGSGVTLAVSLLLIFVGYLFVGRLNLGGRFLRLALASQVGLAWIIFGAAALGLWFPLRGWPSWLIWSPALVVWLVPRLRRALVGDFAAALRHPLAVPMLAGLAVVWLALMIPMALQPDLAFFEGSPNHDNFFWIMGAEHLQRNAYLDPFQADAAYPVFNAAQAILGPSPAWGRMGAEGMLAVVGGALTLSTIRIYNFAVVALSLPWIFTVFATARIMCARALTPGLTFVAVVGQPVLIFFISNGNLPNLLGTLFAGGLWLCTLLLLENKTRLSWSMAVVLILLVQGVLASYPEIAPFAALPPALYGLWCLVRRSATLRRRTLGLAAVAALGLVVNPITAQRAWYGFWVSFNTARDDVAWTNLLDWVTVANKVPSLVTLSVPSASRYNDGEGWMFSLGIALAAGLTLWRRHATVAVAFSLAGFVVLLAYTIVTAFSYGWQKSVQFSGIPFAAFTGVLAFDRAREFWLGLRGARRWLAVTPFLLLGFALLLATYRSSQESLRWSHQKGLSEGQLALRDALAATHRDRPILVDGATFDAAFFHSMWASRTLQKNPLLFSGRDLAPGGYLHDSVTVIDPATAPFPTLLYGATAWLEAFDGSAPVVAGDHFARVVRPATLITATEGFVPAEGGLPQFAAADSGFDLRVQRDGWLEFSLVPRVPAPAINRLEITATTPDREHRMSVLPGARGNLSTRVPLVGGALNVIRVTSVAPPSAVEVGVPHVYAIRDLKVTLGTARLSPTTGVVDFGAAGNSTRYAATGLADPGDDATWTAEPIVRLSFIPERTEHDVALRLIARPALRDGVTALQHCDLFFNGNLIFTSPFTEPGVLRATIPAHVWNEVQIAEIQLHLPDALPPTPGSAEQPGLALVRLETSRSE